MRQNTRNKFLALGFNTKLIDKLSDRHLTFSAVSSLSKAALIDMDFSDEEASLIIERSRRKEIPIEILDNILKKSGQICCYCADGSHTKPFQIHHIQEYYKTQDNEESNLMLVCPTHHSAIHKKGISIVKQKETKASWENIWTIAEIYREKSIAFPFGAFELVDYSIEGSITEIFSFASPNGSVCRQLLHEAIERETKDILQKQNKIILTGASGSGKTTMAKGIAGIFDSYTVYTYINDDRSEAINEVLVFLSLTVKPIILIIDNANTKLHDEQIERILAAAETDKKVIIVSTNNTLSSKGDIEHHFPQAVYPITWNFLKGGVRNVILHSENEVIAYLNRNDLNNGDGFRIGSGRLNRELSHVIDGYMRDVENVWELIFLMTSGLDRFDKTHSWLYSYDRIDLVVLFIGINQIGQVESGTSIEDILTLYRQHSCLNKTPPPDYNWLNSKLDELVNERILKEERGRYNTIHRKFAISFIDICHLKVKADTEEILNTIFGDTTRVQEIVILWNWLKHTPTRNYINDWYRSRNMQYWIDLFNETCNRSLWLVGSLADLMWGTGPGNSLLFKEGFKNQADAIVLLINTKEDYTLQYLKILFLPLKRDCPEIIKEIMHKTDMNVIAEMVRNTEPGLFENFTWLFNTLIGVDADWVMKFSELIKAKDFIKIVNQIPKGNVDALYGVVEFQRVYIETIKISQFKIYLQKFADILKGCGLDEIKYFSPHTGFRELAFYGEDIGNILNSLSRTKLSKDFCRCYPRDWGNLLSISLISRYIKSDIITQIIDDIDTASLERNISLFGKQYIYELRVLVYQLCYGSSAKRKDFSAMLYPHVKSILVDTNGDDNQDILKAFYTLDHEMGQRLCSELNKPVPSMKPNEDIFTTDYQEEGEPISQQFEDFKKKIREMEEQEIDYYLEDIKFKIIHE